MKNRTWERGRLARIINIPLHSEVPKALVPAVAQPDRRPASRGAEGALGRVTPANHAGSSGGATRIAGVSPAVITWDRGRPARIINIPLHSEVPKALAPAVAQPDRRPASRGAEGALGRVTPANHAGKLWRSDPDRGRLARIHLTNLLDRDHHCVERARRYRQHDAACLFVVI